MEPASKTIQPMHVTRLRSCQLPPSSYIRCYCALLPEPAQHHKLQFQLLRVWFCAVSVQRRLLFTLSFSLSTLYASA